jgi:hypothetical protein
MTTTVACAVAFGRCRRGRQQVHSGLVGADPQAGRVPRIARLMALALRFEQLLDSGQVADYATLARLGHVSRARISQIMNLRLLATDIQEQILFLPPTLHGRDQIHLGQLQPIAQVTGWPEQRRRWANLLRQRGVGTGAVSGPGSSPNSGWLGPGKNLDKPA